MAATETTEQEADDEKIFEINVQQVTTEMVTVRAESREQALEELEEPQDRDVQKTLARKPFDSLMERRATDGRRASELEDRDDPEIDIDLTE